jgi:purine nucleosidase
MRSASSSRTPPPTATSTSTSSTSGQAVILDHDGGNDDFIALILLLRHQRRFKIKAVITIAADSLPVFCTSVTRRLITKLKDPASPPIPVGESTLTGVHPFPHAWRLDSSRLELQPALYELDDEQAPHIGCPGQELMARILLESEEPVIICVTGPLTNIAWCLEHYPNLCHKIKSIVVMGGALDVEGNLHEADPHMKTSSQEWNFYWDAPSARRIISSTLPVVLVPLDATNAVPIRRQHIDILCSRRDCLYSELAAMLYATTAGVLICRDLPYFAWDVLTVAYIVRPEDYQLKREHCEVLVDGNDEGRLVRARQSSQHSQRAIQILQPPQGTHFYDSLFADFQCSREGAF